MRNLIKIAVLGLIAWLVEQEARRKVVKPAACTTQDLEKHSFLKRKLLKTKER